MATMVELEKRVASLETALTEAQDAVRRMAKENNNLLTSVSKVTQEVAVLKAEVSNLKTNLGGQKSSANVSRY